ncbi:zinc finger protein 609a [Betta splendens]|uniref:Zinc finger protein 609a n=1 Tax=Betta splendens TaxID=158456 RepID=A0A6P7MR75_BETSP|nr:zinc finger protein 609a [Betta splendens]XP_029008287.1 zinc finger protein 609a [Betta splendens]XP_029008288.1 zinc finger protein 609a [Betta splendens]XP_029008289.1 zinc finger protein 609a [Betta splendens]
MSLSSGPAGGKGVDSNAVDTYDSGDEWDIGVGNLIIDLEADLEKDKLEMSSSKEGGGMAAPPSATAALPENIKFVSPVAAVQSKESKSKSKRSKNSKDSVKGPALDGAKKEVQGRAPGEPPPHNPNSTPSKGSDKSSKPSRSIPAVKKDKDGVSGKTKKDKMEVGAGGIGNTEKEPAAPRGGTFDGQQNPDLTAAEHLGNLTLDSTGIGQPVAMTIEQDDVDGSDSRNLKKVVGGEKMESPVSTPAPPLHLLSNSDISSPCEQIMVRTRSVAVNTADASLATEPECLGPCEPGTSVNLEGIVWQETEDGMLVVNVTWRNKTYVGTLLDCTRHDWAPPRFCESPTSDVEMRSGRGRGKRMRPSGNTPINDNSNSSDNKGSGSSKTRGAAANSKGRRGSQTAGGVEDVKASPSSAKRKTKPASDMEPTSSSEDTKASKRMRTNSTGTATPLPGGKPEPLPPPQVDRTCPSPILIDCPHPNCNKKYKHINGLKYHQAHAHNDEDVRLDQDGDSEYGDDPTSLPDPTSCNGAAISPARSTTPKGRGFDAPSPSSGRLTSKGRKKGGDAEPEVTDGGEEGGLTDDASNDGLDDRKAKKTAAGGKSDKVTQKSLKPTRPGPPSAPGAPSPYAPMQASSPALGSVVQSVPKSPQLKGIQPKPPPPADPASSPVVTKDKKKKDKKRREGGREGDSPKAMGKGGRPEEATYTEVSDALLNGSTEAQQSRLASIKAEADKVYSFSDNAPSPSIGVASRMEAGLAPPLHLNQNGADNASVKTSSPAYSDISDAGEDGEGREAAKVKAEPDQGPREAAKKTLFPPQAPSKESPYYPIYDAYYSPSYPNPSPGTVPTAPPHVEAAQGKVKKEEEPEVLEEGKVKVEPQEERKVEPGPPQPSVIQQRSNMYTQPLYYSQYYVPPYPYPADQAYHAHLLASNPALRQQYEDRQRQADKKAEAKERDMGGKEEWKQKASVPPNLSRAPSLTDLPTKGGLNAAKAKEPLPASEQTKSVIMAKGEDPKAANTQPEGLKMKLSEAGHHVKEEAKAMEPGRPAGLEPAVWYRQEDSRSWPYVYPSKYSEPAKLQEDDRWKDDRERDRDRKGKEERLRPKDGLQRDEVKEGAEGRTQPSEEHRGPVKEARPTHMQFSSPLAQHQGYMPYMHGPYGYSPGYEASHPGYRGMPSVMMQNYPGSYLSASYPFTYGGKVASGEEGEKASRSSPTVKPPSEAKALDLLQQHASQYKSKSPSMQDSKTPHERERDREREREGDRPRSSPSQRILPSHHHLGPYPLLSGQYDLSYASGLSSSAIVASQHASAPSMYPPPRR